MNLCHAKSNHTAETPTVANCMMSSTPLVPDDDCEVVSPPAEIPEVPPEGATSVSNPVASAQEPMATSQLPTERSNDETANALASSDQVVLQKSRSLWRVIPPLDPTDPVEDIECVVKGADNHGRLIGASRRGRAHAHDGKYREDSFAIEVTDDWMLAAVGDGAGSKPLARVGSCLATHAAVEYLRQHLRYLDTVQKTAVEQHVCATLAGAMANALTALTVEATRRRCEVNDFSTTLLLIAYHYVAERPLLAWAQVGDGGVILQRAEGECLPITQPDRGSHAGETLFLTSRESQLTWGLRAQAQYIRHPLRLVAMGTDGVLDDFTPPLGELGDLFTALQPLLVVPNPDRWLLEWLNYERRGSFDDRTLVVLVPPHA